MYQIGQKDARAIAALWYELDKYLYFGLQYCDGESIRALHEQLKPLIEQPAFDAVC